MNKSLTKLAKTAVALAALAGSQAAQAQACIDQQDLSDAVVYFVPVLSESFQKRCASQLAPNGFMATQGDTMIAQFEPLQADKFPAAMRVLDSFTGDNEEAASFLALTSELPPESIRPLVDGIIANEFAKDLKLTDCTKIERGLSLIAPLPPENVGGLVSFLMDVADVKKPTVCPYVPE
ncbi:hypothetical protein [Erythrobacter litoralis]|uniref:Secreted protein n=1 Tax=Erythrobacter litoralis (strain HTCC2594) TaxID=314225 RepID=Q2NAE0_ERYLH|nr:hypothetical protein [Erythrobacter litoralis]ABC63351.1 hypothetical protein ELI_06295 [Erythrobacter litoralis HTCC2594]